ncbi:Zinc finger BED domain-containing protein 4 [Araneus ventricosus]|uniref:Zinc finger BED domain-containing protein 4 n=1 Tax=Araneus ventricosus TaxID=182803 RepID=A0A4Y2LR27_ARAVE|nr:Zinc finger BED domain-containing protein 4 [Araneus ventricosus]
MLKCVLLLLSQLDIKLFLQVTEKTVDDPVPGPSRISTLESQNNGSTKSSVDTETATNEFPVSHVIKSSAQIFERRISSYLMKKLSVSETQKINNELLKMFIFDYQPFNIVNDRGFRAFVSALNPSYRLPSRDTIVNTLLPAIYEQVSHDVRQACCTIKKACLTTDCWTSANNESFMSVTAHYLDEEFKMNSLLLDVSILFVPHTSANLASETLKIVENWNLQGKILVTVTDNASNIVGAIKNGLKWQHLGCFAHTINLILKDAQVEFSCLVEKVKSIVCHFKRSTAANSRLMECQVTSGKDAKKLIQDVPTRWNSTFYMLERFVELESCIRTTVALLDADLPYLTAGEWKTLQLLCKALKPFEDATTMASGENYATASLIIIIVNGLNDVCSKMLNSTDILQDNILKNTIEKLQQSLLNRLGDVENNNILAKATFLDPRFKDLAFKNKIAAENVKRQLTNLVANMLHSTGDELLINNQATGSESDTQELKFSFWDSFDQRVSNHKPKGTASSRALLEINRYLEEGIISRKSDPLLWWRSQKYNYPHLSSLVQEMGCALATSVPCERVFSKAGNILTERRSRLNSNKVKKLLFLNCNWKSTK